MGMLLDKLLAGLNLIAHKLTYHTFCLSRIFDAHLEHSTGRGLHGGFPELLGVHLAQTLVTLQRNAVSIGNLS